MVAAFIRSRNGPASRSAALRKMAARSVQSSRGPVVAGVERALDGGLDVLGPRLVVGAQRARELVRRPDRLGPPGLDPLAVDDGQDLDLAVAHLHQRRAERRPLGAAGRVAADGLVDGGGGRGDRVVHGSGRGGPEDRRRRAEPGSARLGAGVEGRSGRERAARPGRWRSDLPPSPRAPMIGPFERTLALRYLRGAQGRDERRGFLRFVVVAAIGGVAVGTRRAAARADDRARLQPRDRGQDRRVRPARPGRELRRRPARRAPTAWPGRGRARARRARRAGARRLRAAAAAAARTPRRSRASCCGGREPDDLPFVAERTEAATFDLAADADGRPGVVLGAELAERLGLAPGDRDHGLLDARRWAAARSSRGPGSGSTTSPGCSRPAWATSTSGSPSSTSTWRATCSPTRPAR